MRKTLPIAIAASAGAAVTATPADAYDSVNATLNDGKGDPKPKAQPQPQPKPQPEPKAQPQSDPVRSEPAVRTPPPRAPEPPPTAPEPAAETVARSVGKVGKTLSNEPKRDRRHEPDRHQPIGRQADPAPAQPAISVNATLNDGHDAHRHQRRSAPKPKRNRRPQHHPPTGSVTALSHESYDPRFDKRMDRLYERIDRQDKRRDRRRLRSRFPDSGPRLDGYTAPPVVGPKGRTYSVDGKCVRRKEEGFPCQRKMKGMRGSVWSAPGQKVVIHRSGETLSTDGRRYETIRLTDDRHVSIGIDAAVRKLIGGFTHSEGTRRIWEAVVRSGRADRLEDGKGMTPDPAKPGSFRDGEGAMIADDEYTASDISGALRAFGLDASHLEADRTSGGVQALKGKRMRVYVGDEELVEQVMSLGVGLPGVQLTQKISRSFASGKLHSVDIRTGTDAGMRAYQQYLESGTLPRVRHKGVRGERFVNTATWGSSSGPAIDLLGASAQRLDAENGGRATTIHRPGRDDVRTLTNHFGDVTVDHSFRVGSRGFGRGAKYSLMIENSEPEYVNGLRDLRGDFADYDEPQDVRLSFSGKGLRHLSQQAIDRIAVNNELDPADVKAQARGSEPWDVEVDGVSMPFGWQYEYALANARHPADILGQVYTRSWGQSSRLYEDLTPIQLVRLSACLPAGRMKVIGPSDSG